ncbi:hypothetical protein FHX42_000040 [Saccharopolyspora lacisalsi]|uniref:Uncharacterized protein n=1 Tax=Halosaccharopolyspora lacisalsi TaxID=1000566 RepID=A0A839DU96_9PSEU|nr:hypothetical protein [Halosaccharopolyspora lacisalsi]MBA8822711.1 hypothetical protein [Halosaccharopolyspora lacisalsi]
MTEPGEPPSRTHTAEDSAAEPPLPRRRIATGVLGALLLCGSVVTGSAILTASPTDSPPPTAPPAPIDGAEALRPDLLARANWPFADNGGYSRVSDERPTPSGPSPTHPPEMCEANPQVGSADSALALVESFYRLLGSDPRRAVRLVSPKVLGAQRDRMVRSWEELASVRPRRPHLRQDGSVVAEVVAEYPDGTRLLLRHALTVKAGPHPMIGSVRLVTARRGPPSAG